MRGIPILEHVNEAPASSSANSPPEPDDSRREFLAKTTTLAMGAGVVTAYGALAAMAARFLYPAAAARTAWLFVAEAKTFAPGMSLQYRAPSGETIAIARQGATGTIGDFIALSSTCPHLGCKVRWENQNQHFFCPCHNGVFDPSGRGIGGPPGDAGQSLKPFPLQIEGGLLYIQVPTETLGQTVARAGHDPCLGPREELT